MAKEEQKRLYSSLPLLVAVVFIAGAVVLTQLPLESVRPEPPEGWESPKPEHDKIKARLWQDPFKVAQDHQKTAHSGAKDKPEVCASLHCINQVTAELQSALAKGRDDVNNPPPAVQMLLVMVRDGESAEDYERRLRNRYAVLSALDAAGMQPDSTHYIRYFRLGPDEGWDCTAEPLLVPFELFEQESLYPVRSGNARPEKLIVVWLAEGAFAEAPLRRVTDVLGRILDSGALVNPRASMKGAWPALRIDLIGPSSSTTLRNMLVEINDSWTPHAFQTDLNDVTIISPWSTASPALLTSTLGNATVSDGAAVGTPADMFALIAPQFKRIGITFVRMIGTDDLLALHLLQELRRRHIDVRPGAGDHIALISEWDTFYGKAFPLTFATMMECLGPGDDPPDWVKYTTRLRVKTPSQPHCLPSNLHTYSYLSGIDGRLPPTANSEAGTKATADSQSHARWTYSESLEVPIGRGQLDYARRLAAQLRAQYQGPGNHKLRAIGVVGSDVYDKMILLHALREEFGDITLFMTDLDARLMHHERSRWTRNVIVASSFGLALNPKYQCGIYQLRRYANNPHGDEPHLSPFAPFRDNYQTALFLACRAALDLTETIEGKATRFRDFDPRLLADALGHPRLFEIGRGQAVDLSAAEETSSVNVHPSPLRSRQNFSTRLFRVLLYLGITAVLLGPVFHLMRNPRDGLPDTYRLRRAAGPALAVLAIIVFIVCVLVDHDQRAAGEPFSLTSGTSAWPGLALRLLGILIGIKLLLRARAILVRNIEEAAAEFELPYNPKEQEARGEGWPGCFARIKKRLRTVIRSALDPPVTKRKKTKKKQRQQKKKGRADATNLWTEHILHRHVRRDFLVPVLMFVVFWLFPVILGPCVGWPHSPCRGGLCYAAFLVIALLYYTTLLALLALVANATQRRMRVVRNLIAHDTIWEITTYNDPTVQEVPGQAQENVANWLDVRFIARTTEGISKVLYFPSLVLLFSIAARMRHFDNWGYPPLILITYSIAFACLIGLEIVLQLSARRARTVALRKMRDDLHKAQYGTQKNADRAQRIQSMMDEITELREGAFRPFSENPIVHALLIPSGGAGLLALLTYLLPS